MSQPDPFVDPFTPSDSWGPRELYVPPDPNAPPKTNGLLSLIAVIGALATVALGALGALVPALVAGAMSLGIAVLALRAQAARRQMAVGAMWVAMVGMIVSVMVATGTFAN